MRGRPKKPDAKILHICDICGKEFYQYESKTKNYRRTFCSKICFGKWLGRNNHQVT